MNKKENTLNLIDVCADTNNIGTIVLKIMASSNLMPVLLSKTSFLDDHYSNIRTAQRVWHVKNNNYALQYCAGCGTNLAPFAKFNGRGHIYVCCCRKCSNVVTNRTVKEIYGVDNFSKHETFNDKCKQAWIENWGTDNPNNLEEKKKILLERESKEYGGYKFSSKKFVDQNKMTFLDRYNNESYLNSEDGKKKRNESMVSRFGVDNYAKSHEPALATMNNFLIENESLLQTEYTLLGSLSNILASNRKTHGRQYHMAHEICGGEFKIFGGDMGPLKKSGTPICPYCRRVNRSRNEVQVFEFIKSLFPSAVRNKRFKTGDSRHFVELDVFIPELNMGVEHNGDYWHANPKFYDPDDSTGHGSAEKIWLKDKTKIDFLSSIGIQTVVIWENEWNNNRAGCEALIAKCLEINVS